MHPFRAMQATSPATPIILFQLLGGVVGVIGNTLNSASQSSFAALEIQPDAKYFVYPVASLNLCLQTKMGKT